MYTFENQNKAPCWQESSLISELMQPIQKRLGVTYFDYSRFYPDKTCIVYFSNTDYVSSFSGNDNFIPPNVFLSPGKHLWQSYMPDEFLQQASQGFNYYHGITYFNTQKDYDEIINFSAPQSNANILNLYVENDTILRAFSLLVRDHVSQHSVKHKNSRIMLPEHMLVGKKTAEISQDDIKLCFKDIIVDQAKRSNQVMFYHNDKLHVLSLREFECTRYLLEGASYKEIARKMNISHRTAIMHSKNVYLKLNVSNHLNLMAAFVKNSLILV